MLSQQVTDKVMMIGHKVVVLVKVAVPESHRKLQGCGVRAARYAVALLHDQDELSEDDRKARRI